MKNFAVVICGPTGSGKSDLAIQLAKILDGEIISADSIAIYKELNIGTAKPSVFQQQQVKHHMIDVVSPFSSYTVSDYENNASKIINDLFKNDKVPIICGGTGFYINSLLFDLSYGNCSKNQDIRNYYENLLSEKGANFVFDILKQKDYETSKVLHPNDTKRVIRALEIFDSCGVKKSEIIDDKKPKFKYFAFSYDFDRNVLYQRINKRVDLMFENGLCEEVKALMNKGLTLANQSMQGIGYKEFFEFDNIDLNIESIKNNIKLNSRRYAKRQITFFKKLDGLHYLKNVNIDDITKNVMEIIDNEINK